jgi:hypothetical protein
LNRLFHLISFSIMSAAHRSPPSDCTPPPSPSGFDCAQVSAALLFSKSLGRPFVTYLYFGRLFLAVQLESGYLAGASDERGEK